MSDLISRQAVLKHIEKIRQEAQMMDDTRRASIIMNGMYLCEKAVMNQPSARPEQPEQRWIPFKTRPLTKEEKEEHPECDGILDCKLPDDGQRILVSISVRGHECVQYDEFYMDDGCYLDSGYEIGTEAVAWRPLPDKYKAESEGDE